MPGFVPVTGDTTTGQPPTTTDYLDMLVLAGETIYPGNSGGPLLDRSGVVVGLSVSAYTLLPEGIGIGLNGFSPIEEALHALTIQREAR